MLEFDFQTDSSEHGFEILDANATQGIRPKSLLRAVYATALRRRSSCRRRRTSIEKRKDIVDRGWLTPAITTSISAERLLTELLHVWIVPNVIPF